MSLRDHVRLLAILNIAFSAVGMLIALLLFTVFGGVAAMISQAGSTDDGEALAASLLVAAIGGAVVVLVAALSVPGLIAGFGLLKRYRWARVLTIVLSALNLLSIPFGTALGAYGLWVLLKPEVEAVFAPEAPSESNL